MAENENKEKLVEDIAEEVTEKAEEAAEEVKDAAEEAAEETVEAAEETAEEAEEAVEEAAEETAEEAEEAAEEAEAEAEEAVEEAAEETAEEAEEAVEETAEEAEEAVEETAEEEAEEAAEETAEEAEETAEEATEDSADETKAEAEEAADETKAEAEEASDKADEADEAAASKGKKSSKTQTSKSHSTKSAKKKAEKEAREREQAQIAEEAKKKMSKGTLITWIICVACCLAGFTILAVDKWPEKPVSYDDLQYDKYITVGDYKGVDTTLVEAEVTDEDVQTEIQSRVDAEATSKEETEGVVEKGDKVKIDYSGSIDGEKFIGGTAKDYELEIGSNSFIEGFEDGLIGKKIGDTVTLDVTFPDDYSNASVAGKDAQFEVNIKAKMIPVTYKYDEKFLKKFTKFDNKKDYEASVKKELLKDEKKANEDQAKDEAWHAALENVEVKEYPKAQREKEKAAALENAKTSAEMYGMDWNSYLAAMQMTEEDFDKQADDQAKETVKEKMAAYVIADKEGIKVSTGDAIDWVKEQLKDGDMTEDDFEEQQGMSIRKFVKQNDIKAAVILERATDLVYENAKVKKKSAAEAKAEEEAEQKAAEEAAAKDAESQEDPEAEESTGTE